MTDAISPATQRRIDALLREIAAGHHLDDDVCEELRGHMTEKLLDYMQGAEPLTEDDAFVLVREHFGDPAVIKTLFRETRHRFSPVLFGRWLGAAVIAITGVSLLDEWLRALIRLLFIGVWNSSDTPSELPRSTVAFMMQTPEWLMYLFGTLLLFAVLRFWRRSEEQGNLMWYHRFSGPTYVSLVAGVFCLAVVVARWTPAQGIVSSFLGGFSIESGMDGFDIVRDTYWLLFLVLYISRFSILLWWFDRPPRHLDLAAGVPAILVFLTAAWLVRDTLFYAFGWQPSSVIASGGFVSALTGGLRSDGAVILLALAGYLAVNGYSAVRRRVIAAVKPVGAYHD